MNESEFDLWIKKILATEEEEISCSVCFDLVSEYVEAELAGAEIQGALRQVEHHINQCLACRDEYVLLRDFVKNETDLLDSSIEDLPRSPP